MHSALRRNQSVAVRFTSVAVVASVWTAVRRRCYGPDHAATRSAPDRPPSRAALQSFAVAGGPCLCRQHRPALERRGSVLRSPNVPGRRRVEVRVRAHREGLPHRGHAPASRIALFDIRRRQRRGTRCGPQRRGRRGDRGHRVRALGARRLRRRGSTRAGGAQCRHRGGSQPFVPLRRGVIESERVAFPVRLAQARSGRARQYQRRRRRARRQDRRRRCGAEPRAHPREDHARKRGGGAAQYRDSRSGSRARPGS